MSMFLYQWLYDLTKSSFGKCLLIQICHFFYVSLGKKCLAQYELGRNKHSSASADSFLEHYILKFYTVFYTIFGVHKTPNAVKKI